MVFSALLAFVVFRALETKSSKFLAVLHIKLFKKLKPLALSNNFQSFSCIILEDFKLFNHFKPLSKLLPLQVTKSRQINSKWRIVQNFQKTPLVRTYQKLGIIFENQFSQAQFKIALTEQNFHKCINVAKTQKNTNTYSKEFQQAPLIPISSQLIKISVTDKFC